MLANAIPVEPFTEWPSIEWRAACEVQQGFMQHRGPSLSDLSYSGRCLQVGELGGDCYTFIPLEPDRIALAIGDASGKGLAAALMISNVQSSLRTAAFLTPDDGAVALRAVNRQVYGSSLADRYATLFYGVFDSSTRTVRYVNAGHNPPMIIRRDGSTEWLETGGAPVGMFADWMYEEASVRLNPGDLLLAYTDGVVEALNPEGEEWGVEGLRRVAMECEAQCADEVVQEIFRSMSEYSRGRQSDDATVVALRVE